MPYELGIIRQLTFVSVLQRMSVVVGAIHPRDKDAANSCGSDGATFANGNGATAVDGGGGDMSESSESISYELFCKGAPEEIKKLCIPESGIEILLFY